MFRKRQVLLSLGATLASLFSTQAAHDALASAPTENSDSVDQLRMETSGPPNVVYPAGDELLGLIVSTRADGTVVAAHSSHVSHASHQSHHSHYSSR